MIDKENIIVKPSDGVAGKGIQKISVKKYEDIRVLYSYLNKKGLDLAEENITQHAKMNQLNPSSVNTIRVITVRSNNKTDIIAAVLRIGINNHVDNFSAGGVAAPIDTKQGIIKDDAVTKYTSIKYAFHPITRHPIKGFQIPYWEEVVNMVEQASTIVPEVGTVGWDIAVTRDGPELIEGNDNWNKDSFQLPYKEGRKHLLSKY